MVLGALLKTNKPAAEAEIFVHSIGQFKFNELMVPVDYSVFMYAITLHGVFSGEAEP